MTHYINYDLRRQVAQRANLICEYCLLHDDESHCGVDSTFANDQRNIRATH